MRPTRALRLHRETLAELGPRDLELVAAADAADITGICPTRFFPCEDLTLPPSVAQLRTVRC